MAVRLCPLVINLQNVGGSPCSVLNILALSHLRSESHLPLKFSQSLSLPTARGAQYKPSNSGLSLCVSAPGSWSTYRKPALGQQENSSFPSICSCLHPVNQSPDHSISETVLGIKTRSTFKLHWLDFLLFKRVAFIRVFGECCIYFYFCTWEEQTSPGHVPGSTLRAPWRGGWLI